MHESQFEPCGWEHEQDLWWRSVILFGLDGSLKALIELQAVSGTHRADRAAFEFHQIWDVGSGQSHLNGAEVGEG